MNRIKIEKILGEEYLVIYLDENEYNYEEQMIRKLNNSNILNCKLDYQENKKRLCYNISGMIPLSRYLELNPLNLNDIKKYIIQLKNSIDLLESYMLSVENIYLGRDGIYADKETGMMKLCILPSNKCSIYKTEFIELLLRNVNIEDTEAIHFAFELFKISLEDDFEIKKIFKLLETKNKGRYIENKSIVDNDELIDILQNKNEINYRGDKDKNIINYKVTRDKEITDHRTNTSNSVSGEEKDIRKSEIRTTKKEKLKLKSLKERKSNKNTKAMDVNSVVVKIFVSLSVLSVLLFILVMLKGRAVLNRILIPYFVLSIAVSIYHLSGYIFEKIKNIKSEKNKKINESDEKNCKLIPRNIQDDIIEISYYPFVIGSREGITDYTLQGKNIEAVHLRIEDTEEGLMFTDMNTEKGTQIGSERIAGGQSKIVKSDTEIVIGDHKYILQN
ncbi:MAG: DUF6382 domain-containing protein [Eubacteriales bacterium]|nr:DUF6382 domain-containing protein [Eubacteriales bacterium]